MRAMIIQDPYHSKGNMNEKKSPRFQDEYGYDNRKLKTDDDNYWYQIASAALGGLCANPRCDDATIESMVQEASMIADTLIDTRLRTRAQLTAQFKKSQTPR